MNPCQATTSKYDHKAARAKMAKQDVNEHLLKARKQYEQALAEKPINCAGIDCDRSLELIKMFRCFFCGAYFCPRCSRAHFGDRFDQGENNDSSN